MMRIATAASATARLRCAHRPVVGDERTRGLADVETLLQAALAIASVAVGPAREANASGRRALEAQAGPYSLESERIATLSDAVLLFLAEPESARAGPA